MEKEQITNEIKRILTNHRQSSLEGLLMLIPCSQDELTTALDELIESKWLTKAKVEQGYSVIQVYKKKSNRVQLKLNI
jgi:hypothetical protein